MIEYKSSDILKEDAEALINTSELLSVSWGVALPFSSKTLFLRISRPMRQRVRIMRCTLVGCLSMRPDN